MLCRHGAVYHSISWDYSGQADTITEPSGFHLPSGPQSSCTGQHTALVTSLCQHLKTLQRFHHESAMGHACQATNEIDKVCFDGRSKPLPVQMAVPLVRPAVPYRQRLVLHQEHTMKS